MKNTEFFLPTIVFLCIMASVWGDLVGYWPLDGNADDLSGNNLHGTVFGNVSFVNGMFNQAASFDGDADYIDCSNDNRFDLTAEMSAVAWIKVVKFDLNWQTVLSKGLDAWRLHRSHKLVDSLDFYINTSGTTYCSSSVVNDGKWHHIAIVKDAIGLKLYLDGMLDAQKALSETILVNTEPVWIGGNSVRADPINCRWWEGLIDEVALYDHALSEGELSRIIAFGVNGTPGDTLVGYWPLDNTAKDVSINQLHGTEAGDCQYIEGKFGQAVSLDGMGDYINLGNSDNFNLNTLTIAAWIKADPFENHGKPLFQRETTRGDCTDLMQQIILISTAMVQLQPAFPAQPAVSMMDNGIILQLLMTAQKDRSMSMEQSTRQDSQNTSLHIGTQWLYSFQALAPEFKSNLNAHAWLWKDHTGYNEAAQITELAKKEHPEYLTKCGGTYSSEWFFSKILHCLRVDPRVFDAAYTWVEHADWMTGILTGTEHPGIIKRCRCAAGHKAMFNSHWGGYPEKDFLAKLDPKMARLHQTLSKETYCVDTKAGDLTPEWAKTLGLPKGIPVAMGAFDAHLGAVGSGIGKGTLVKIIGTSTCDMVVWPTDRELADVPGICGIVDGSILPGYLGLEAGQSAVGDIFNWFVNYIKPSDAASHQALTEKASKLKPGQSGLIALDWNNGNRTVLADQRLTGLLLGQTLHTKPEEIYRALIEATAFGALTIINRFEEFGVLINEVVNCGGIAEKSPLVMQIYADILGRAMKISRSAQSCALGSAVAAAVVAGRSRGGYDDFASAQAAMTGVKEIIYKPISKNNRVYAKLYKLYKQMHDGFSASGTPASMANIMKELLEIKESCQV